MLEDRVRMESFRRALSLVCEDKIVIDVGAGTGILSTMALDYGASQVFAIEKSSIAFEAEKNFKNRPDRGKICLFNCLAEDFRLARVKADLIVSEWMGYFLLMENMLPSVLAVRDKVLKKDGDIVPRSAEIIVAGYGNFTPNILK